MRNPLRTLTTASRVARAWAGGAAAGLAATALTFAAMTFAACAPTTAQTGAAQPAAEENLLYVCNQNDATVSVIDMSTQRVVRTVDMQRLGFSANAKPHHVAVEPDGSFWYVTLIGENRIVKLDRNDRVVGQATFETPGMLALHPTEDLLFVGRSMTAVNPPQRIGVVRRSDMKIDELSVLFPRPHALALESRSNTVFTASLAVNQMATVDVGAERVTVKDIPGEAHALMQFAISPDGRRMAVSGELSHKVITFDLTDPRNPRQVAEIDVGPQPFDPIFTKDGKFIYVPNKAANTITVIDAATNRVTDVIRGNGIAQPHGVAVSADGRYVYISNNNLRPGAMPGHEMHAAPAAPAQPAGKGTVVVIDVTTRAIAHVIEVGNNASGIGTRTPRP